MRNYFLRLFAFLASTLFLPFASAETETTGVLNQVGERFLNESATWGGIITGHASWLFWTLVAISMVWTFGLMALRKADIQEFFAEFIKFLMFVGFFWWLLINGPGFAMSIINSLRQIGAEASGLSQLNPSTPIDIAFEILAKAWKSFSVTSPIDNLSIFLISLAILACMAVVAANILLALITAYVLAYAGVFVLGFGGSRWTSDIAISYFKNILSIALKLLAMTLLVGIAVSIIDGFHSSLSNKASMEELMIIFVVALVLVILINTIPNVIAGLVPGGGVAATSGSSFGAGAILGAGVAAAGMAAGGAAMAAKAGLSASAGATGAGSAIKAAMAAAQGASSFGGGSDGGGGGGGSISGTGGGSASDTPFAQAAGLSDSGSSSGSSSGTDGSTGSSGSSGESGGSSSDGGAGGESSGSPGSSETAGSYSSDSSSSDAGSSSGGESGESGSSASGEGGSASDTPFAQAAGLSDSGSKSGIAKAMGVASTLGGAVKSVAADAAKSKIEGFKSDFKESVKQSTGGKVATKINPEHFKGKDDE